jgi:hypothetical protein
MNYFDHQHHILKYLCKFKYCVTSAHLNCLKDEGANVAALKDGASKITCTDAIVDKDKLRQHFINRKIMTGEEFDIALSTVIKDGYVDSNFLITEAGKAKNKEVFKAHYASPEFITYAEENGIDVKTLLFNEI